MLTHHQWEAPVLRVELVKSQVQDKGSHGVEEGKDAKGHKELGRGREVPHEVHGLGSRVIITERHLILDPVQPAGGRGGHSELGKALFPCPGSGLVQFFTLRVLQSQEKGPCREEHSGENLAVKSGTSPRFYSKPASPQPPPYTHLPAQTKSPCISKYLQGPLGHNHNIYLEFIYF